MSKLMLNILAGVLLIVHAVAYAADINSEKQKDIEELMELVGTTEMMVQMSEAITAQMTRNIRMNNPEVSEEAIVVMKTEIDKIFRESVPSLMEAIIPLYSKYFTHAEIKELRKFYESDIGKKTIKVMPSLMQESIQLGQQWASATLPELRRRVAEKLKQEGYEVEV